MSSLHVVPPHSFSCPPSPPEHRCVFESRYGVVKWRMGVALMCKCGLWGMALGGVWEVMPSDLLPSACTHLTRMRKAGAMLRSYAIALAVGFVLAWLISI